jgi:hypothetical protein
MKNNRGCKMAKLAIVGYGTSEDSPHNAKNKNHGLGPSETGYTYVVNDNVRTGDKITPVVRHRSGKTVYATTAHVIGTAKNASTEKGQEMMLDSDGNEMDESDLTSVYTGKELGLKGERGKSGKFVLEGRSTYDKDGNYEIGRREAATRGGNVMEYLMNKGLSGEQKISQRAEGEIETFKSYSSAFLPIGGKL